MADDATVLDVQRAADYLGAHAETVRRMARNGKLPAYKMGRVWRFNKAALRRWAETHHIRSGRARILVADDDRAIRSVTRRVLEAEDYDVSTAANGAEAIDLMRGDPPDLVILDLKMPVMDGPTALKEIRRQWPDLPVVVLSGYTNGDLMTQVLQYSPIIILAKPAAPRQIIAAVRGALGLAEHIAQGRRLA